jgi:tRNA pseudouridine38-40 synthase
VVATATESLADDVSRALAARDRRAGGPTARPEGLYLTGVTY